MANGDKSSSRLSLLLHGAALIVIYSAYGALQEKIMKSSTYGPNNQHFTSSSLLIVFNRLFSISVGLAILFYKSRQQPGHGSFAQRIRPASSYFAYASVAVFNFLSTSAQYQALRFVSYTTQSLAKTAKMCPVLIVGYLVYKKKHAQREWVAAGVILIGCATYLFSTPPIPHGSHASSSTSVTAQNDNSDLYNGLMGALCLGAYLFFDGLVSTTQEKVFGKNPSSSDPFGPESPVLDQMIWTNVFACLIAVVMAVASTAVGGFWSNLELLMTSMPLLFDVCVFSAASAVGLIVLLNTIASFGALTSSLIMTIRQFLSILINAGLFGNFGSVSLVGWTGVFWVASGIWIKINKKYDPPKQQTNKTVFDVSEETQRMLSEKGSPAGTPLLADEDATPLPQKSKTKQYLLQYVVPVLIPVLLAIAISPFLGSSTVSLSSSPAAGRPASTAIAAVTGTTETVAVDPVELGAVEYVSIESDIEEENSTDPEYEPEGDAEVEVDVDVEEEDDDNEETGNTDTSEIPTAADEQDEALLNNAEAEDAAELAAVVEGGSWDAELHKAIAPACKSEILTRPYNTDVRTGFVSYPRSGNSYLRSLIERATGYQTSSIYCDKGLAQTFLGECDHKQKFFVKTHVPALPKKMPPGKKWQKYYSQFDQTVHVVRNPFDALVSWFHLHYAPHKADGTQDHETKLDIGIFDDKYRSTILDLAERWRRHSVYWQQAPILTFTLRYEDLKAQPIPNMMALLSFLLPDEDLPPLSDVACIAEHHENLQAYHSRRSSDFATWDQFTPSLRNEVLRVVRRPFCFFGYNRVLLAARGDDPEVQKAMDGFCDKVEMEDDEYDEHAETW
ncbi:hypothetical protein JCM8547_000779 [Rhodosporidiobolus lusitaniae]